MEKQSYFVSHGGEIKEAASTRDLESQISSNALSYIDFIWVRERSEWVMLANYFAHKFPPPKNPPAGETLVAKTSQAKEFVGEVFSQEFSVSNEPIWFLYREHAKYGPYRYLEVVHFLQKNETSRDDFVWKPGFDDWRRVRSCAEFSEDMLKKLAEVKNIHSDKVFLQRKFPRVPYQSEVILHDEHQVSFGEVTSLSEGGAFIQVPKASLERGDRIKVHFTKGDLATPFNCIAEVTQVSKGDKPGYNVKFIYIEEDDRENISGFAKAKTALPKK